MFPLEFHGEFNREETRVMGLLSGERCMILTSSVFTARCTIVQSAVLRSHVVRPSVCLSVTLVDCDHIGWKSWKLIARIINLTPSLFVAQRPPTYSQVNVEVWGRLEVRWEKVACRSTKAAISLKRVKIYEKLLWGAYRNSPTLFRILPFPTLYGLLFPKIWGLQPPLKTSIVIISGMDETTDFKFDRYIQRVHPNKIPLKILEKRECGRIQGLANVFKDSLLSQEWVKLQASNLAGTFTESIRTKAH